MQRIVYFVSFSKNYLENFVSALFLKSKVTYFSVRGWRTGRNFKQSVSDHRGAGLDTIILKLHNYMIIYKYFHTKK